MLNRIVKFTSLCHLIDTKRYKRVHIYFNKQLCFELICIFVEKLGFSVLIDTVWRKYNFINKESGVNQKQ